MIIKVHVFKKLFILHFLVLFKLQRCCQYSQVNIKSNLVFIHDINCVSLECLTALFLKVIQDDVITQNLQTEATFHSFDPFSDPKPLRNYCDRTTFFTGTRTGQKGNFRTTYLSEQIVCLLYGTLLVVSPITLTSQLST